MKKIFITIILSGLFLSCERGRVFHESHEFDGLTWNRFDIIEFTADIEETEDPYDVYLHVRYLQQLPLREFPVNFTITMPSGEMRSADHPLEFFNDDGKPTGDCMGDLCDLKVLLREEIRFHEPGRVIFEIENKNTKVSTPGIMEVSLELRRAGR